MKNPSTAIKPRNSKSGVTKEPVSGQACATITNEARNNLTRFRMLFRSESASPKVFRNRGCFDAETIAKVDSLEGSKL